MFHFPKPILGRVGVRSVVSSRRTQLTMFSSNKYPVPTAKEHSFPKLHGLEPGSERPIYTRLLQRDRYLQVGVDDKDIRYYPVPKSHNNRNLEEVFALLTLPKSLGVHPELKQNIILEVVNHELMLRLDGTRLRYTISGRLNVKNVTLERAVTMLAAPDSHLPHDGRLGEYNGKMVHIVNSSDGCFYLRCGIYSVPLPDKFAHNPEGFTLEDAGQLLRGVEAKKEKKEKKEKKAGKKKEEEVQK